MGGGIGAGKGNKLGPGIGDGGLGRKATKQEILARRWRFDLTGDPKTHADKLATIGFTVAVADVQGRFHIIRDIKRRPVELAPADLSKYADAVRWANSDPRSVQGLAQELRLPFVPRFVVLFLPQDREEKIAAAEHAYAARTRRDLRTVTATWFDFRLRGASFDPTVIRQE
jgi:hypothetical protein